MKPNSAIKNALRLDRAYGRLFCQLVSSVRCHIKHPQWRTEEGLGVRITPPVGV